MPAAQKTIEYMGGAAAVLQRARADYAKGEFRWVAQIGSQLVFADPTNQEARNLAADAYEQLGYQAESATARNAYLQGASELRNGVPKLPPLASQAPDVIRALPLDMLFDYFAVRLNGDKAAGKTMVLNWQFTDTKQNYVVNLENSALSFVADAQAAHTRRDDHADAGDAGRDLAAEDELPGRAAGRADHDHRPAREARRAARDDRDAAGDVPADRTAPGALKRGGPPMNAILNAAPTPPPEAAAPANADAAEIERMRAVFARQRAAFAAAPFPERDARRLKLQRLITALQQHQDAIVAAVNADFGVRSPSETRLVEVMGPDPRGAPRARTAAALDEAAPAPHRAAVHEQPRLDRVPAQGRRRRDGTWNFPVYLTLGPLVAALAAGNRVMIKGSDLAPQTTALLKTLLAGCFDEDEVAVFGGELAAARFFNTLPFDHLVFTGSPQVGREVMRAAAPNLTPVTLELGGKSPAIVGPGADLADAALRIAHGKAFNAGQICVAPDYAMVPRGQTAAFTRALADAFARLYPTVGGNAEYTSIVSERHAARLRGMLDDARRKGATIVSCGSDAGQGRQMPLQVVSGLSADMQLMREEIFGPILPVVEYDTLAEALATVARGERPLAMYAFGLDGAEQTRLLRQGHAGGVTLNDWGWHVFQHDLPFGGIGNSGMGSYHGEEGFRTLSHGKSVFKRHRFFPVALFYPPYGNLVQRLAMRFYLGKGR